ncbi:MAG TPA: crosslink repair DNA glycosylase YcaQ family protein [Streptosporangiaceae bacterium]|jgi:hypothetical protein
MDLTKLRAWWAHKQGLDAPAAAAAPADVLARTGWARSVGGANPYFQLFSRAGIGRAEADEAVAGLAIHELPTARGCTYVLPAADYAVGLKVGEHAPLADVATCAKLGVPRAEIDKLAERVVAALEASAGPLDPRQLKDVLGDAVRNLGEAGKKKGVSTTLPVALGLLQAAGEIRRVPVNGRIDQQKYSYVRWSPPGPSLDLAAARAELARRYWSWTGGASLAHFRWFSALTVKDAAAAVEPLGLVPLDDDLLALPEDAKAYADFTPPPAPSYTLVAWLDGLTLLRRDLTSVLDPADAERALPAVLSKKRLGELADLPAQGIFDRGRLAGLWEYDVDEGAIAWAAFGPADDALRAAVARTEEFTRDQLGDAKGSSQDNPSRRKPRIDAIRELADLTA